MVLEGCQVEACWDSFLQQPADDENSLIYIVSTTSDHWCL